MDGPCYVLFSLIFLHLTKAGEYCRQYFDNHLKYHQGFYCDHFCCGNPKHKYCCNVVSFRYDGRGDTPRSVDVTSWNSTFWIMVGCILGTVVLIGSVMLFVFCVCCKHDSTHRALTERRCSVAQNITTTEPGGESSRSKSANTSSSQYTPVKTDDSHVDEKHSPPMKDIFME